VSGKETRADPSKDDPDGSGGDNLDPELVLLDADGDGEQQGRLIGCREELEGLAGRKRQGMSEQAESVGVEVGRERWGGGIGMVADFEEEGRVDSDESVGRVRWALDGREVAEMEGEEEGEGLPGGE